MVLFVFSSNKTLTILPLFFNYTSALSASDLAEIKLLITDEIDYTINQKPINTLNIDYLC